MKFSKQTMMALGAIAILGALIISLLSFPPAFAFILGMIAAIAALNYLPETPESTASSEAVPPVGSKTIYVGNLPYRANESEVKQLFAEYGEVFAVRLMKDKRTGKRRGFGFVVMNSGDADTAISQLNNKEFGQRTLKVREANEPKSLDS
ncbi:RNA recognition motif domain-containing protein [Photobacterium sp. TY1-4]|uniref:RNA recognition motif domain-containing protein n=1 Tax=Photobacterium sp. TY1-4 TaxID=2899122 RepID=UPI0021BE35EE|nr:RNA-binding protein [Photobacterium sp. TY1-4]UXI01167.1 RNA-binding protein [Photobacterium sp. TY1-4]